MNAFKPFGRRLEERLNGVRERLMECLRGECPCDWLIQGGAVLNIFSGAVEAADVWLCDGFIVYVGSQDTPEEQIPFVQPMTAKQVFDARGMLILPGFADAHVHVESTMLTPWHLGRVLALTGTTTIITDPHEMVNVAGEEGLRYMLDNAEFSPVRQIVLVPSCVPAAPGLEHSGADWTAGEIGAVLDWDHPRISGLAEMMSYTDVIHSGERAAAIVKAALDRGAFVQGHCFGLRGRTLAAYILAGVESNHESLSGADVKAAAAMGLHVDMRLTSSLVANQVSDLAGGLRGSRYLDGIAACTDDVHIRDILKTGHLNATVRTLIDEGIAPVDAVRVASLNVWRNFGVRHAGAVAPSFLGDLQLLSRGSHDYDCLGQLPRAVFVDGRLIVREGRLLADPAAVSPPAKTAAFESRNTVKMHTVSAEQFLVKPPRTAAADAGVTLRTINHSGSSVINAPGQRKLPLKDGAVSLAGSEDLAWIMVFNRYGQAAAGTGLLQGYPLKQGAVASTISHDSHNLTVIFRNPDAAALAVNSLINAGGGIVYVDGDMHLSLLPLPVGGLMSAAEPEQTADLLARLEKAYQDANGKDVNIMQIVVMALPVVPALRVSDMGIVDVLAQKIIPLFIGE
ncbi:MAG: amidohydrolase family protein [Treponema sp.]|nr:amidohydrolase family protein [Treponema sp.]